MKLRRIISLCCLQALFTIDVTLADDTMTLIVGPGETLDLQTSEAATLEAALDGGPLKPIGECSPATACQANLTAPMAGDHWLALASRDHVGNRSPIRWIRLRVDNTPPNVELETATPPVDRGRFWMPPRAGVAMSADDDLAEVARVFLAIGEDVQEASDRRLSAELPATGNAKVRAWAVDHTGNLSAEKMLELAIDSTPPSGEIRPVCAATSHIVSDSGTVIAPGCQITVEVLDSESGVAGWTPRVDGEDVGVESLEGPWTEGPHTLEVTTVDAVGNSSLIPYAFSVDDSGPEISWEIPSGGVEGVSGEMFYRPPVTLTAEAADAIAGLASLSASTDDEASPPIAGPIEVDGDRLMLRAMDRVGNVSQVEASWRLDQLAPVIELETPDGEVVAPGTLKLERGDVVNLRAIDRDAGLDVATYSLDVKSADILRRWWWSPPDRQPLPETLSFPWPGEIVLKIEALDRLGNRSTAMWTVQVLPSRER